ncbi:MAG: PspC domain-containing protein [Opitutaceae bacterium]|jgi:phage shock protein PspC (stress-responsive transcriptional regulator)
MNKVVTINLNGNAYPLEESGYEALRAYLENASSALEGNPDRDEIIADIEQSIADKFRSALGPYKTVVASREVERIIAEMGPVEGDSPESGAGPSGGAAARGSEAGSAPEPGRPVRRLYRIRDGAMIGGVCNGLATFFGVDVTIVRLVFLILAFVSIGVIAYLVMMIVVPRADTPAEKAAAAGAPSTAQEFIRRAKEGYYEGMRTFRNRREHREWRRRFKQEMRGWSRSFRQEMRENADEWRRNWRSHWGHPPAAWCGPHFAMPFVSLLKTILDLAFLFVVLSLVATRGAFGFHIPGHIHLWLCLVILFIAYQVLTWPLRAMKHAFYWGAWGPHFSRPFFFLFDFLIWAAVVALLLSYGFRHSAQVHEFVDKIPPAVHDGIDSFRQWWARR